MKQFTPEEAARGIAKLQRRIDEVKALDPKVIPAEDQRVKNAELGIRSTILEVYGPNSPEYQAHQWHDIWEGAKLVGMDDDYMQKCFSDGIPQTISMLEGLVRGLEERRAEHPQGPAARKPPGIARRVAREQNSG